MSDPVSVAAPAKLNLFLHITGRRAGSAAASPQDSRASCEGTPSGVTRGGGGAALPQDSRAERGGGYHTLESLVAFVGLADRVTAAPAPPGRVTLTVDGPFAAAITAGGEDNLVLRAARALAAAGGDAGARLHLTKNIPVAAGLGGGSADAAAALLALATLWGVGAPGRLDAIALALGADVPVCLAASPSRVSGIGEGVAPAPALPGAGVLLVNPGVAVETGAVFAAFDALGDESGTAGGEDDAPAGPFADAAALAAALAPSRNDLTAAARGLVPAIADVLDALDALGAGGGCRLARMAGSGATCFGLFDDPAAAEAARRTVARGHPGWWTWAGGFAGRG